MNQITPAPRDSTTDFVPADGPDQPSAPSYNGWLWLPLAIIGIYSVFTFGAWSSGHSPQPPPTGPYENVNIQPTTKLLVHVVGAVRRPGLYQLPSDARVNDAIKQAQPLPNADVNQLNLAAWAEDGSRIEVPFKSKTAEASRQSIEPTVREPLIQPAPEPGERKPSPKTETKTQAVATPAPTTKKPAKAPPHPLNINRASLDDLTLLPGVGPAIAQRIVDYRKENGAFNSVDDLDEVKGIGEKKLEKLRPYVRVK